ncbi:MAG: esterase/lipase family protein, partial [Roseiflexaceae bacterium]
MPALSPGDTSPIPLTSRMILRPAGRWQGDANVAPPSSGVLGEAAPATRTFELFTPAEPPIELDARPAPAVPGVLGEEQQAGIEYQPAEDAAYVLLQEIHTPDGTIYDFTLPQPVTTSPASGILGAETPGAGGLWFPINPVVADGGPAPLAQSGVLGIESLVGEAVGGFVIKRVVQMLKSPIQQALLAGIRHAESQPRVLRLTGGTGEQFQPIESFEAWRALLPPGAERRVLLFIHGFASSVAGSHASQVLPELAQGYDAVIGYDHPTIAPDPLENARELLAMVPDDLRLSVDILAHSRGGLVARSLIELADPAAQFTPHRLITHGTPHGGTRLADPERWDRLISLGMTAASWLA